MAASDIVARRYAAAYFDLASSAGGIDAWRAALAQAAERLGDPGILEILKNPRVAGPERVRVALAVAGDLPATTRNLVRLLVERGRTAVLGRVLEEFDRLGDRASGTLRAEVTSAVPVDTATTTTIEESLSRQLGGPVETTVRINPQILGGLVIRIGDRVIDGSVRTRLEQLRAQLA